MNRKSWLVKASMFALSNSRFEKHLNLYLKNLNPITLQRFVTLQETMNLNIHF